MGHHQFLVVTLLLLLYIIPTANSSLPRKFSLPTHSITAGDISPSPPPPPAHTAAAFKPSIAVIVGVLTTLFSITFLLLLYAKHCKRGSTNTYNRAPPSSSTAARKNSGVDRTVIESLPVFRFGSLRGEKDGLECAVCLNRFESTEILRLLPKCKHAFHVECVDTWLDAHSTCPLCRYRVDAEDVLLLLSAADHPQILPQNDPPEEENQNFESLRRVSGRHSSAGEIGGGLVKTVTKSHRDCLAVVGGGGGEGSLTTRRSLDSWNMRKNKSAGAVSIGCFDREIRKDRLLMTTEENPVSSGRRRLEHRIVIGGGGGGGSLGFQQRWSDVQPSDLLYLRSEMIMSDSRRLSVSSSGSRPSVNHNRHLLLPVYNNNDGQNGRSVINGRSVSEITGLNRFGNTRTSGSNIISNYNQHRNHHRQWWGRERQAGVVSRWLAWISQSPPPSQSQLHTTQQQQTQTAVA